MNARHVEKLEEAEGAKGLQNPGGTSEPLSQVAHGKWLREGNAKCSSDKNLSFNKGLSNKFFGFELRVGKKMYKSNQIDSNLNSHYFSLINHKIFIASVRFHVS